MRAPAETGLVGRKLVIGIAESTRASLLRCCMARAKHCQKEGLADPILNLAEAEAKAEIESISGDGVGQQGRLVHELVGAMSVSTHCKLERVPVGIARKERQQHIELAGGRGDGPDVMHSVLHDGILLAPRPHSHSTNFWRVALFC